MYLRQRDMFTGKKKDFTNVSFFYLVSDDDEVFIDKPDVDQSDQPFLVEKGMTSYKPRLSELLQDGHISEGLKSVVIDDSRLHLGRIIGTGKINMKYLTI